MKLFITGASGMLGKALVQKLEGHYDVVKCSRTDGLNIHDRERMIYCMKGCDVVIHTAAETNEDSPYSWITNVEGTRNLLEAGKVVGIKQFIHISTIGVYGHITSKISAESPHAPVSNYEKTKSVAEKVVVEYQSFFPTTILRPTLIVGPNAYWKRLVDTLRKGFPMIGSGKNVFQLTYLSDLVDAIELCILYGKTYNDSFLVVSDEQTTLKDILFFLADSENINRPSSIPYSVGILGAYFLYYAKKFYKQPITISPYMVEKMVENRVFDSQKLRILGWDQKKRYTGALTDMLIELFPPTLDNL